MEITGAYRAVITEAHEYITRTQDHLRREFGLDECPRHDWEQENATLVFSDDSGPWVAASIEIVGSISRKSNT